MYGQTCAFFVNVKPLLFKSGRNENRGETKIEGERKFEGNERWKKS
jgi:hypothetical protein